MDEIDTVTLTRQRLHRYRTRYREIADRASIKLDTLYRFGGDDYPRNPTFRFMTSLMRTLDELDRDELRSLKEGLARA